MLVNKIILDISGVTEKYLTVPLSSNFSIETQQYDFIDDRFNISNNDIINQTIDYEKIKLYPVSYGNNVDSLNFKLHFYNNINWDNNSTNITDIGFTSDDVLNRRKRLEKTFIRLSFYDSKDLKKQNLLYYSTIFIDVDKLYAKYIYDNFSTENLNAEFFVPNPKISSKVKSFEGFNIYLFKDDIVKNEVKTIYMRADFNNALNGRSILFTKGKPNTISGYTMEQLYDNLFYDIQCTYDNITKKYVYYIVDKSVTQYSDLEDKNIKNTINIDLYQAKVI